MCKIYYTYILRFLEELLPFYPVVLCVNAKKKIKIFVIREPLHDKNYDIHWCGYFRSAEHRV